MAPLARSFLTTLARPFLATLARPVLARAAVTALTGGLTALTGVLVTLAGPVVAALILVVHPAFLCMLAPQVNGLSPPLFLKR